MKIELLDENSVIPYLTLRGIISGPAEVEVLTGGVSNVVFAVRTQKNEFVLKQALPELRVATVWAADQRRAVVEAKAMKLLHSLTPSSVPELIDVDPERFTVTMERLPRSTTNWKVAILNGTIYAGIGNDLGEILAVWHNYGARNENVRSDFAEDALFEQLRVTPFYRAVAKQNYDLTPTINALIDEITNQKLTIVHGDFSPKNIMITTENRPIMLDFEVVHAGNPVFDLAFLSAHLLCKYLATTDTVKRVCLAKTALNFLTSYRLYSDLSVTTTLPQHVVLIARARVEGVSPVNYLDAGGKARVLNLTSMALRNPELTYEALFQ